MSDTSMSSYVQLSDATWYIFYKKGELLVKNNTEAKENIPNGLTRNLVAIKWLDMNTICMICVWL